MAASAHVLRSTREHRTSKLVRAKADQDAEKLRRIAEDIRRMTAIYRERLEDRPDVR